jgi:transposase
MERVVERGCGLDVHKKSITACVRVPGPNGAHMQEVRTFGTTTGELLALRDWLEALAVTHVAMESTGVYWKPIFYVLEERFAGVLVDPAHMAQVPGRKTDVQDCVWTAQLLEHGLLRGSFVPPAPSRELRDLTRYRKTIVQERSRAINRLHETLEDADIKLASVATDVLGVSGRAMLAAMKLTGHKTEAVYRRYAIVAESDLRDAGTKLTALLGTTPESAPLGDTSGTIR